MDANRINQRKLELVRVCNFVSGNNLDNTVVSLRNLEDHIHSRAFLEEAIISFFETLSELGQPLPADPRQQLEEKERRIELHGQAVDNLEIALGVSLGTIKRSADPVPKPAVAQP